MSKTGHTPGKLEVREPMGIAAHGREQDRLIVTRDATGALVHIAETFQYQNHHTNAADGTSPANAERLAMCWNTHDALLGVVERFLASDDRDDALSEAARAAIALAD